MKTTQLFTAALATSLAAAQSARVDDASKFTVPTPHPQDALVRAMEDPMESPEGVPDRSMDSPKGPEAPSTGGFAPDHVLTDEPGDGQMWAVGSNYKAAFGPDGATFIPFLGSDAPRNFPVTYRLDRATVAGEALGLEAATLGERSNEACNIEHGALTERYLLGLDSIEQTFVFDTLPGRGELVVSLGLETDLVGAERADGSLLFSGPRGGVVYGDAIAYDARGKRTDVSTRLLNGQIQLVVPAAFVETAALPLVIDPVNSTLTIATATYDEFEGDVAYDESTDLWFIAYGRTFSATDTDVYVRTVDSAETVSGLSIIDSTTGYWSAPKIANLPNADQLLVVSSVVDNDPTTEPGVITGRTLEAATLGTSAPTVISETTGFNCILPDVGGDNFESTTAQYLVSWIRVFNDSDRDVHARMVDRTLALPDPYFTIDNFGANDDVYVSVSDSLGDSSTNFLVTFEREPTDIYMRRVPFNGDVSSTSNVLVTDSGTRPSASSFSERSVDGHQVAVIAYEIEFGTQASIYTSVVDEADTVYPARPLSAMEDFDFNLDQIHPAVTADGEAFVVTYSESYMGSAIDYDAFMCSGGIVDTDAGAFFALGERHKPLSFSSDRESLPNLASKWSYNGAVDEVFIAWDDRDDVGATNGDIDGAMVDPFYSNTLPTFGLQVPFCNANENASGESSWISIYGTPSTASSKWITCEGMPANTFGYFLASMTPANTPNPAGSAGRLCLGGNVGRFDNNILNSGALGEFTLITVLDQIPQPTGMQAVLPGDTWFFTTWHRDAAAGAATSNFSNSAQVHFE